MKDNYKGGDRSRSSRPGGPKKPGFKKGPFKGRDDRAAGDKPWKKKEWKPRDSRDGDKPREKKSWGEKKPWEKKTSEKKTWDKKPRGDRPDRGSRDFKSDDKRSGARFEKRPYEKRDERPRQDRARDDRPRDDRPRDDRPREDRPRDFKKKKFPEKKFGENSFGDWRPSRDKYRDDRPGRPDRSDRPKKFDRDLREDRRPERREERPDPDSYAQRKSRENRGERLIKARPAREALTPANIFGFHAARAAWLNPQRRIKALYLTETGAKTFEETAREALEAGLERPIALQVDKEVLDKMLPRDAVHQGVAIVSEALDEISVQDFVIAAQTRSKTVLVMLDQVTDPHNVGAIIRSACAFGASGMIMQKMHAPELEGTLLKSASGAAEHLPVAYETNLSRSIEELKEGGFFVIGLAEEGEKDLASVARQAGGKIVLVMGSEGAGMRRLVREHCDALAHLPVTGPVKSLNVSNAAAVALYAVTQG